MIYHLTVAGRPDADSMQKFEFEAEYRPMRGAGEVANAAFTIIEMLEGSAEIVKGDAIVSFAEMLKGIRWPLDLHRDANLIEFDIAYRSVTAAYNRLGDPQLAQVLRELDAYRETIENGENPNGSRDSKRSDPASVLGIAEEALRDSRVMGVDPQVAIVAKNRLLQSTRLVPLEGSLFLVISTGPVGNPRPAGTGEIDNRSLIDPRPEYHGYSRSGSTDSVNIFDIHQIGLSLTAPPWAESFSFDFNFFSSEYPEYVNAEFNDTFYAILEAPSTNGSARTNIAFDSEGNPIEVDSNYFQQPFHPIPNTGTGFDAHGSTGWLRTS